MEENEMDLHKYVLVLLRQWKLMVALPVAVAVVVAVISLVLPKTYAASAIVVVTKPRYVLQLDPRIETVTNIQNNAKAYLGLATSDEVLTKLLADTAVAPLASKLNSLQALRKIASASTGVDPTLIVLTVKLDDPAQAAAIVNAWASLYTDYTSEVYGQAQTDQTFFQGQMTVAETQVVAAQNAVAAYEAENPANILVQQLENQKGNLAQYLRRRFDFGILVQDIQDQRTRMAALPANATSSPTDDMAILTLVSRVTSSNNLVPPALQLQLTAGTSFSGKTVGEQVAYLDSLEATLQARLTEIDNQVVALQPETLSIQQQLAEANAKAENLKVAKDLAQEAYTVVARKVEEARISAATANSDVRLASRATVSNLPVEPRPALYTAVAAAIALFLTIVGILGWDWWRSEPPVV